MFSWEALEAASPPLAQQDTLNARTAVFAAESLRIALMTAETNTTRFQILGHEWLRCLTPQAPSATAPLWSAFFQTSTVFWKPLNTGRFATAFYQPLADVAIVIVWILDNGKAAMAEEGLMLGADESVFTAGGVESNSYPVNIIREQTARFTHYWNHDFELPRGRIAELSVRAIEARLGRLLQTINMRYEHAPLDPHAIDRSILEHLAGESVEPMLAAEPGLDRPSAASLLKIPAGVRSSLRPVFSASTATEEVAVFSSALAPRWMIAASRLKGHSPMLKRLEVMDILAGHESPSSSDLLMPTPEEFNRDIDYVIAQSRARLDENLAQFQAKLAPLTAEAVQRLRQESALNREAIRKADEAMKGILKNLAFGLAMSGLSLTGREPSLGGWEALLGLVVDDPSPWIPATGQLGSWPPNFSYPTGFAMPGQPSAGSLRRQHNFRRPKLRYIRHYAPVYYYDYQINQYRSIDD